MDPALTLVATPAWRWCEGMLDMRGRRVVDLTLYDGGSVPDLRDFATAGALLGLLDSMGALTDVVRDGNDWIVAVDLGGKIQGYASDVLGEAAAWAMLAVQNVPLVPMAEA